MSLRPFSVFDNHFSQDWQVSDPYRERFFADKNSSGDDPAKPFSPLLTMDIFESDELFTIVADLPGVKPEDLSVTIERTTLIIKACRRHLHDLEHDQVHRLERSYGDVQRRVMLPKNADMDNIQSVFKNGVLSVTVSVLEEIPTKSRRLIIDFE